MSPLRPGASEVFRVIVPCELVAGGQHEVRLRIKVNNNRVTFEGACDWRVAQAVEKLSDTFTCRRVIDRLKETIRSRGAGIDVVRCMACTALVVVTRGACPACSVSWSDASRRFAEVPAWQRIYCRGRVS